MEHTKTVVALAFLVVFGPRVIAENTGHPIEKVITKLQDLSSMVQNEAKTEEVTYTKFQRWCKNSEKTLNKAIGEEKALIDELESLIEAKEKESDGYTAQIDKLSSDIKSLEAAALKAQKVRDEEAETHETAKAQLTDTIKAIKEAIIALQDAKGTVSAVAIRRPAVQRALVLSEMMVTNADQRDVITKLLDSPERPELEAAGDQKAHVKKYEFKSDNVVELLKKLQAKFEDKLQEEIKGETNSLNSHKLAKDARDSAQKAAEDSKAEKELALSETENAKKESQSSLQTTTDDMNADTESLDQTMQACSLKASEWAERSAMREKEIKAMAEAVKILSKVTGVRTAPPSNPVPPASPIEDSAFVQRMGHPTYQDARMKVVKFLQSEARLLHAKGLERLAMEVAAHLGGPFDEVNNMIQKMIFHLEAEQTDEDNHKNWCDLELAKTNKSKIDKDDKLAELDTKIEEGTAKTMVLAADIEKAAKMIADISSHVEEATEIRETGKKENAAAIKDAKDAQTALAQAVAVLEAHYKDSGMVPKEAWEFVQKPVELPEKPEMWGSSYTGVADPMNQPQGIIALLKSVSAEFAEMEANTQAQESMDEKAYEEEMKTSAIEKARREQESEMKSQEKKRMVDKLTSLMEMRKHVAAELESVEQYLKDLQPACVDGDSTYDERKSARAAEIEALKESQVILAKAFEGVDEKTEETPENKPTDKSAPGSFLRRVRRV